MTAEPAEPPLFSATSTSLVARFLSPALFKRLSALKTGSGFTLSRAIRSGQQNPDSSIGIYAGDAESYSLFKEIFDPVIRAYHGITGPIRHVSDFKEMDRPVPVPGDLPSPAPVGRTGPGSAARPDPGVAGRHSPGGNGRQATGAADLPDLDPDHLYILSSRVRVARNISGVAFTPHIRAGDRQHAAQRIRRALAALPAPLQGHYHPMDQLNPEQVIKQAAAGTGFPPGDRFQAAAGIIREFPASRGVYAGHDRNFFVWVNEEDHLRIICLENTGDLSSVFNRLVPALNHLGRSLGFASDPCLGFLNACPTNIGTAMRAGVHIRLPKLEQRPDLLGQLIQDHGLQIRGTAGEKTAVSGSVFDISNRHRLGIGETRLILTLHTGIAAIIEAEKNL